MPVIVRACPVNGQSHLAVEDPSVPEPPRGMGVTSGKWHVRLRVTWTLISIFAVECLVFSLAMLPGALFWEMFSLWIVRLFAGSVLRATPVWTFYLRLNGARIGRGVYVNSLSVNDHNLLEFGNGVVIGDGVHLSGHTVEYGIVRTAAVRLGDHVTIGLGTVVGIGVEAGPRCQVGALSLVPKFTRLKSDATYVGAPVREL